MAFFILKVFSEMIKVLNGSDVLVLAHHFDFLLGDLLETFRPISGLETSSGGWFAR